MKPRIFAASDWVFGINDPSLIAWVIVAAYGFATFFCWRAQNSSRVGKTPGKRMLWASLSLMLLLLGFNKQLDLHDLVMDIVADVVSGENRSRALQGFLIVGVIVLGAAALWLGNKFLRESSRELRWAYFAFLSLLVFQFLRFMPGTMGRLLVTHIFTEEEGLFHVHTIELIELPILIIISYWALFQSSVQSSEFETQRTKGSFSQMRP